MATECATADEGLIINNNDLVSEQREAEDEVDAKVLLRQRSKDLLDAQTDADE